MIKLIKIQLYFGEICSVHAGYALFKGTIFAANELNALLAQFLILSPPQESAENYNRMLSERTKEIQELRKQLLDRQQQLAAAERQNSTAIQEGYLETIELKAQLAVKDGIIKVSSSRTQHSYSAVKFA